MAEIGFSYFKQEDALPVVAELVDQAHDVGVVHGSKGLNLLLAPDVLDCAFQHFPGIKTAVGAT
eukprot:4510127-Alexandrium_andersonii.AAC.1